MPSKTKANKRKKQLGQQSVNVSISVPKSGQKSVNRKANGGRSRRSLRRRMRRNGPSITGRLSACAMRYAMAITTPWSQEALGACVPQPAGMTYKTYGWVRTSVIMPANGYGFVIASPSLANDMPCLYASGNGYAGIGGEVIPIVGGLPNVGVLEIPCANLPYARTQFIKSSPSQSLVAGRIVSVGLRVRYTGNDINLGGQVYALREPYHASVQVRTNAGGLPFPATYDWWGAKIQTRITNFNRSWTDIADFAYSREEQDILSWTTADNTMRNAAAAETVLLYPFSNGENDFFDNVGVQTRTVNGTQVGIPTLGLIFTGTPGQPVAIEYIIHVEYTGPPTAGATSPSDADPVGAETVREAAADAQAATHATDERTFGQAVFESVERLQQMAEAVVPYGVRAAQMVNSVHQMQRAARFGNRMGLEFKADG